MYDSVIDLSYNDSIADENRRHAELSCSRKICITVVHQQARFGWRIPHESKGAMVCIRVWLVREIQGEYVDDLVNKIRDAKLLEDSHGVVEVSIGEDHPGNGD